MSQTKQNNLSKVSSNSVIFRLGYEAIERNSNTNKQTHEVSTQEGSQPGVRKYSKDNDTWPCKRATTRRSGSTRPVFQERLQRPRAIQYYKGSQKSRCFCKILQKVIAEMIVVHIIKIKLKTTAGEGAHQPLGGAQAKESGVQGCLQLYSKFDASLTMRPYPTKQSW